MFLSVKCSSQVFDIRIVNCFVKFHPQKKIIIYLLIAHVLDYPNKTYTKNQVLSTFYIQTGVHACMESTFSKEAVYLPKMHSIDKNVTEIMFK